MQDSLVSVANLLSVVTLVLTGQPIDPVNVFMLLGFMDIARIVTCRYFSSALLQTYDAYASLGRIEDFLLLENIPAISRGQSKEDTGNKESSSAKGINSRPSDPVKKMEEVFNLTQLENQEKQNTLCVSSLTQRQSKRDNEFLLQLGRMEDFLLFENLSAISRDHKTKDKIYSETITSELTSRLTDQQDQMKEVPLFAGIKDQDKTTALIVSNLIYKPEMNRKNEFILDNVTFALQSQSLTVITGPVGSGKSTLLSAIAGEISDVSGTMTFQRTLVYVPQTAWIFSGTIRGNSLFGQPKYNGVIESCALTEDIQRFPDYD